jgi:pimeloyl-ACP methyl ester carboxylesterase
VVLVHGLRANAAIWDRVGPMLAERFRVVALDLEACGLSGVDGDPGWRALGEDVGALVDQVQLVRPVLVGHGVGAAPLLLHAGSGADHAGVISLDWLPEPAETAAESWRQLLLRMREDPVLQFSGGRAEMIALAGELDRAGDPDLGMTMLERELEPDGDRWRCRHRQTDLWDLYQSLRADPVPPIDWSEIHNAGPPFVVLASARSGAIPQAVGRPRRDTPGMRWSDAGHNLPLEAPEQVVELVRELAPR